MKPDDTTTSTNQQQESEEKNFANIIRVKHDTENPYVMLNRQAMRDPALSLEAVGLWARLLSNKDNWQIHVTQLMEVNNCGRDKMYRILKELITNGYAYHAVDRSKGKYQQGTWYVFESKKSEEEIKKMFPFTENPYTAKPNTANPPLRNTKSKKTIDKKEYKENAPASADAPPSSPPSLATKKLECANPANHPGHEAFVAKYGPLVGLTLDQHNALVAKHGRETAIKAYEYLAAWKISKAETDPKAIAKHTDYYRLTKWVIKEVIESGSAAPGQFKRQGKLAISADVRALEEIKANPRKIQTEEEVEQEAMKRIEERKKKQAELQGVKQ